MSANDVSFNANQTVRCIESVKGKFIDPKTVVEVLVNSNLAQHVRGWDAARHELRYGLAASQLSDILAGVTILGQRGKYKVECGFEPTHEHGIGGKAKWSTKLCQEGVDILLSVKVVNYDTYRDDSEDHETGREMATFLLTEDPFGRAVFNFLTKR